MAPGVCVTSFRMLMRRTDLGHWRSRGLLLMPAAAVTMNSWSIRDRSYCTDKWLEETSNSAKSNNTEQTDDKQKTCASGRLENALLANPDLDISKLKVAELRTHLREHGLKVTGKKDILLKRLQNYLQQQQQQQQQSKPSKIEQHQQQVQQYFTQNDNRVHLAAEAAATSAQTTTTVNEDNLELGVFSAKNVLHVEPLKHDRNLEAIHTDEPLSSLYRFDAFEEQGDVTVEYIQGLPHLTIPLPSRNEKCRFALKPVSHKVGDLLSMLKAEDRGIDRATVLNKNGVRIASTCNIESLMDEPFWLHINDQKYKVVPPTREKLAPEDVSKLGDIRALVAQLYEALHVGEYHIEKEHELAVKLEDLKYQVTPLEQQKAELSMQASRRTNMMTWVGLGLMSVQFGILARLTWWEYSWDIMEPVTYFVTYGTAMACYAYFCITKQDYTLPEVKDRQYLLTIHKRAKKKNFDIDHYNSLKRQIAEIEYDLRRLRDPLNLQLPPHVDRAQQTPPATPSSSSSSTGASLTSKLTDEKSKTGFRIPFLDAKN